MFEMLLKAVLTSTYNSNGIRNDLQHPNEYIRGSTLRFLCKIKEAEILESLIPSITDNLQHRHRSVVGERQCAAVAITCA